MLTVLLSGIERTAWRRLKKNFGSECSGDQLEKIFNGPHDASVKNFPS